MSKKDNGFDFVKVTIEDQGGGIPQQDIIKIFDPYFSSKEMGAQKGMGLGLTIAHALIIKHGGLINVESEVGVGTLVSMYLPAYRVKE